ncbi:hypothetical protein SCACP_21640 [Sporomusa carbonis]
MGGNIGANSDMKRQRIHQIRCRDCGRWLTPGRTFYMRGKDLTCYVCFHDLHNRQEFLLYDMPVNKNVCMKD